MKLSGAIQEALIVILCFDDSPGGASFVKSLVPLNDYDVYYYDIAECTIDYITRYGHAPQDHMLDLIEQLKIKNKNRCEVYQKIWESMLCVKDGINRKFILEQAADFVRYQRLKRTCLEAVQLLEKDSSDNLGEIERVLQRGSQSVNLDFNPGLQLSDPASLIECFQSDSFDLMPSGITEVDNDEAVPFRGGLHLFMALPNRGKSWWLSNLGKWGLINRLRVVHVTLEMSEKKVMKRYLQSLFGVTKRQAAVVFQKFDKDALGKLIGIDEQIIKDRPSFDDPSIVSYLRKKLVAVRSKPPLYIKQFAPNTLTAAMLDDYLENLFSQYHFSPDLIIVDYADLMKKDGSGDPRHALRRIYEDLRAIMVKRNAAGATASQANRAALKSKLLTEGAVAEDFSKIATCDVVITYNQTDEEKKLGLARLFVAKNRDDVVGRTVLVSQAYATGQFCMDSMVMRGDYWGQIRNAKPDDTTDSEEQ